MGSFISVIWMPSSLSTAAAALGEEARQYIPSLLLLPAFLFDFNNTKSLHCDTDKDEDLTLPKQAKRLVNTNEEEGEAFGNTRE